MKSEKSGYELTRIKGGAFMMGSPESEEGRMDSEGPLREVVVPDFYIGPYPVTNQQYGRFLEENPDAARPDYQADPRFNQPDQPVVGVNWESARRYAEWAGLRLPTESQWEYACRAGSRGRYYTGDAREDLDRAGWHEGNSGGRLHAVGEKEPNAFGLYDMHGNIFEFVEDDWHKNFEGAPNDGSAWIDAPRATHRVLRGGGWSFSADYSRSALRAKYSSGFTFMTLGFRLVQPLDP
ncbi:MAG: formylglycine-generating enzyme family protein [Desulfobacterales bacterium]|nr:formylglycine-generating enzyme family protein [Desulfobacterales bacterium]